MTLQFAKPRDVALHYQSSAGAIGARPVVFLNSLGTDFRIWQDVACQLTGIPTLMMDKRGHGLSDMGPITMDLLAEDVADLMDHLGLKGAVICGVSVGGMIAQALAARRSDLVAGLVLCNTGAKIGDAESWNARIETVNASGIEPMADAILERWFSRKFRDKMPVQLAGYRNMLTRIPPGGYAGTCAAIRDTDLSASTRKIGVPTTCIGGSEDQATPPDLVSTVSGMIAGSSLHIIQGVGHLPCIEAPDIVAEHVNALWQGLS